MKERLLELGGTLGVTGAIALALILGSAITWLSSIEPMLSRGVAMDREIAMATRTAHERFGGQPADRADGPLQRFYRYFERKEQREDWLAKLYAIAKSTGIDLPSADYRLSEPRERIERLTITVPVKASYSQVRRFTTDALAQIPILSLDQVSFRRKATSDAQLEAEIVFTLYSLNR